jgi:hypothetical protein
MRADPKQVLLPVQTVLLQSRIRVGLIAKANDASNGFFFVYYYGNSNTTQQKSSPKKYTADSIKGALVLSKPSMLHTPHMVSPKTWLFLQAITGQLTPISF